MLIAECLQVNYKLQSQNSLILSVEISVKTMVDTDTAILLKILPLLKM